MRFSLVAVTFPLFDLEMTPLPSVRYCAGLRRNQATEGTVPGPERAHSQGTRENNKCSLGLGNSDHALGLLIP